MDAKQAASLLDHGSYFLIYPIKPKSDKTTPVTYGICIKLSRSEPDYLKDMFDSFGGFMGTNWKTGSHYLTFSGKHCINLIRKVMPYLIIKQKHAQVILEYQRRTEEYSKIHRKREKLTDEERQTRADLAFQLMVLNGGPKPKK